MKVLTGRQQNVIDVLQSGGKLSKKPSGFYFLQNISGSSTLENANTVRSLQTKNIINKQLNLTNP